MKTIVTHFSPDCDAVCSIWLAKKFLPGFSKAQVKFVPAGKILADCDALHVDTGFGQFDHHQTNEKTCAAVKVFQYLQKKKYLKISEEKVLERLVSQVNEIDHFQQVFWENADSDRYDFLLDSVIEGLKQIADPNDHLKIVTLGGELLDAVYRQLQNKLWAEDLIINEGVVFDSPWGKAIGFITTNDEVVQLAQKKGYKLVIRKDPRKNYVRIKSWPITEIDLTKVYEILAKTDTSASWFLHSSKHMVLNGSTKNPDMKPTRLSLEEIIEIIKKL